ncbi:hypothetical protein ASC90_23800 [Rhizobium sp. Root1220]|nr:hypothetical protein ASC90_23800 [Rhizobium sp. Root1220]
MICPVVAFFFAEPIGAASGRSEELKLRQSPLDKTVPMETAGRSPMLSMCADHEFTLRHLAIFDSTHREIPIASN